MKRKFLNLAVGLVVLGLFGFILVGMGCDSVVIPGPPGPAGPSGSPGLDAGSELPRTVVTILDVNDGGLVEPGRLTAVTFTITTGDGDPISINDLDRFSIYVSGPSNNYQRVILPEGDLENNVIMHGDGTYTYTFAEPFPGTYAAPANDSDAFGPADNELTGTVAAGSFTVAIEARRTFALEGESIRDAGDATFDFGVGGAPVMPRQVVLESSCEKCHAQLTLHGQNRFSVTGCVLCHTNGAEDRISSDPAKETPGVSIQFANMIHRIHRGAGLPSVEATKNSSDPYRYEVIGFGETVHDYSDVKFPVMPGGTGFNEQTRNCGVCHDGAAQGVQAHTNPSRAACSGCHDDIDWDAGTRLDHSDPDVMAGTLTRDQLFDSNHRELFLGALVHNFNDGQCSQCHNPQSPSLDSAVVHVPPLADEANTIGLEVVVQSVEGQSGAGFFSRATFRL